MFSYNIPRSSCLSVAISKPKLISLYIAIFYKTFDNRCRGVDRVGDGDEAKVPTTCNLATNNANSYKNEN